MVKTGVHRIVTHRVFREGACADQTSDAQAPSEEVCNGMDDDCDGVIDEDVEEIMCGEGMCQRTARCGWANGGVRWRATDRILQWAGR